LIDYDALSLFLLFTHIHTIQHSGTFKPDEVELFARKIGKVDDEENDEDKYVRVNVNIIVHKAGSHTRSGGYATCQILRRCEKGVTFEAWLELQDSKRKAMRNPQDLEEIASVRRFTMYPELNRSMKDEKGKKKRYVCVRAIYIDPSHLGLASMHRKCCCCCCCCFFFFTRFYVYSHLLLLLFPI